MDRPIDVIPEHSRGSEAPERAALNLRRSMIHKNVTES